MTQLATVCNVNLVIWWHFNIDGWKKDRWPGWRYTAHTSWSHFTTHSPPVVSFDLSYDYLLVDNQEGCPPLLLVFYLLATWRSTSSDHGTVKMILPTSWWKIGLENQARCGGPAFYVLLVHYVRREYESLFPSSSYWRFRRQDTMFPQF